MDPFGKSRLKPHCEEAPRSNTVLGVAAFANRVLQVLTTQPVPSVDIQDAFLARVEV